MKTKSGLLNRYVDGKPLPTKDQIRYAHNRV